MAVLSGYRKRCKTEPVFGGNIRTSVNEKFDDLAVSEYTGFHFAHKRCVNQFLFERTRLGKWILQQLAENLWVIGTVGLAPVPICVAANLRNIPEEQLWGWDCFFGSIFGAPTWYFQPPLLDRQKG